ncbi:hypothetical protein YASMINEVIRUS_128 [Yasminevirus sp. GU-2018]|uniref:Uncharacterized protein n=1 Tax=Yasminevirus sp. GU-2018 TaxID=2420051 RepID=A0A5K0U794_9VIRU|nr:hypothetical protein YASMINEVIRUS_128 [Yasminevirus sp. GU-2018]
MFSFFKKEKKVDDSNKRQTVAVSDNDLRSCPEWNTANLWLCDIEEKAGESDNDFLFLASISGDGDSHVTTDKGRCIFQDCMYDIQQFKEDTTYDGKLDFAIAFGRGTKERKDAPAGWTVQFKDLIRVDNQYVGKIVTSWWGERNVKLINYSTLDEQAKKRYPDLVVPKGKYFKSRS